MYQFAQKSNILRDEMAWGIDLRYFEMDGKSCCANAQRGYHGNVMQYENARIDRPYNCNVNRVNKLSVPRLSKT